MQTMDNKRMMASGYSEAGASRTRRALKGFTAPSFSPREDIDWNNMTLRQRGRMLAMSSPIAASAVNTNQVKVIGTGLELKAAIDREALGMTAEQAKEWQRRTEREFRLWADWRINCDATGVNNFKGLQQLALRSWLVSGDVFALIKRSDPNVTSPYGLRVHLIEADRVSTPSSFGGTVYGVTEGVNPKNKNRVFDGVEVDRNDQVVAYHISDQHPGVYRAGTMTWKRVAAYGRRTGLPNILHVLETERPEQYRGVTYLAQAIEPLLQVNRYTQSEVMAALVQSFFSAWIEMEAAPTVMPFNEVGGADETPEAPTARPEPERSNPNDFDFGPGSVAVLKKGEKVVFGNPNIPSAGFEKFTDVMAKHIGANLTIPKDVLLKEFNKSYSASRASLMETWEAIKMRRAVIVDSFCQPVYEIWLAEAVALGRISAPGFFTDPAVRAAWCKARWIGPVQGQLDPTKEVKADILAVAHGFKSHEQVTLEYGGGDWHENVEKLRLENAALAAAQPPDTRAMEEEPDEPDKEEANDAPEE